MAGRETLQRKRSVQLVRPVLRDRVGERPTRSGRGLESSGTPATVQVQALDGCGADDRAGIGADVDDAAPLAVHPYLRETRNNLDNRFHGVLDRMQAASITV